MDGEALEKGNHQQSVHSAPGSKPRDVQRSSEERSCKWFKKQNANASSVSGVCPGGRSGESAAKLTVIYVPGDGSRVALSPKMSIEWWCSSSIQQENSDFDFISESHGRARCSCESPSSILMASPVSQHDNGVAELWKGVAISKGVAE